MLGDDNFLPISVLTELFVYFDDLFEIQFLEINVHSSHQKINQISLLQFVVTQTAQGLQHLRHLSIEIVEGVYFENAFVVFTNEIDVIGH